MKTSHCCLLLSVVLLCACSRGNYPEAGNCGKELPWYAVCTHSSHGLSGWTSACVAGQDAAQSLAEQHAQSFHDGNSRWTGIAHMDKAQLLMR